ncbi:hypothetical protein HGRIS_010413 [Hohenbuehelia grisea]|uniref:Aminoglycoside phosphotransferase domain-containing protein n=1 Tax=Hohenbuehelia grisea TaxID=104357 RepID=A0ABR3J4N5_9AGAR
MPIDLKDLPLAVHHKNNAAFYIFLLRVWLFRLINFRELRSLSQIKFSSTIRISSQYMMKGGPFVRHVEAQTMAFVLAHTSIPVPRPHKTLVDTEGTVYIIMDYIDAPELSLSWKGLTKDQQTSLMRQLGGYLDELRGITPPAQTRLGALDSGPLQDPRMGPFGPFDTCLEFANNYGYTILTKVEDPSVQNCLTRFKEREHEIVFSHGDLAPRNILVEDGKIAAILDWECAGWCPEYWEVVRGIRSNLGMPSFGDAFQDLFCGRYDDEIALEYELSRHIFRL